MDEVSTSVRRRENNGHEVRDIFASNLLPASHWFLFGLFLDPEDEGDMFLRNVGWFVLYQKIELFITISNSTYCHVFGGVRDLWKGFGLMIVFIAHLHNLLLHFTNHYMTHNVFASLPHPRL
jgi:hypothetical protein